MPTYRITIDGKTYRVESPTELTDVQAYQAVQAEHEKSPDVLAEKNARLRAASALPLREEQRTWGNTARSFIEGATAPGTYLAEGPGRVVEAAKTMGRQGGPSAQSVSGIIRGAGVAALPFAPAAIAAAPAAAIPAFLFGGAGAAIAGKTAELAGADSGEQALAEDIGGLAGGGGGAALGTKVIKPALSRAAGALRQPAAFVLEQAAEPLKASRALLRYGASKLRGGPDVGAEMGVSPRSLGATINEPVPPAPAVAPPRSIPSEPAAIRSQVAASQRDELGLPAVRPNAQGVQGEDDLSMMRQELLRREMSPDLPLFRQQELLESSMGSRVRGPAPVVSAERIAAEGAAEAAANPELQRVGLPGKTVSPAAPVVEDDAAIIQKLVNLNPVQREAFLARNPRARQLLEGGVVDVRKPRSEITNPTINPQVMEQQFQQANPTFRAMEEAGAFGGERTVGPLTPSVAETVITAPAAQISAVPSHAPVLSERRMAELVEKFGGKMTAAEIKALIGSRRAGSMPVGERTALFEELLRRMGGKGQP